MLATLTATELRVLWRNRTAGFSAVALPLALGIFWAFIYPRDTPTQWATIVALQLSAVLGMSIYSTATATIVARKANLVLKRLRTSEIGNASLLAGLMVPGATLGIAQLVVFAALDAALGAPVPADPGVLVLAVLAGLSLCLSAALATTLITPTPERAHITTLPLLFVLIAGAIALPMLRSGVLPQALMAVPGASVGRLTALAFRGGAWTVGTAGLPVVLPALLALAAWPLVFTGLATRYFRWQPHR